MSIIQRATELLKLHEGFRSHPYKDSLGILTIGYGRNLETKGIFQHEAEGMLRGDILDTIEALTHKLTFWDSLNDTRKVVLIDMGVNLGVNGLLRFKKMIVALEKGEHDIAALEMLDSKWATQVKSRANDLAQMMKNG